MLKLLLVALNAKYIHSNLAVYSLKAYCEKRLQEAGKESPEIEIAEYTINQSMQKVLADLYERKADVLFFSCYIWNRREVEWLVGDFHKVCPQTDIWLGGPEVSFDADTAEFREHFQSITGVMRGEGEEAFYRLAETYLQADERNGKGIATPEPEPLELDELPFPYENLDDFSNRIVYYESSRGCPFQCSYCLSSVEKTLRFRSLKSVKKHLEIFLAHKVRQVKFIDRTFNCNHQHALQIWQYLKEHDNGITNFHFEIAGDLLTDEEIQLLGQLRPGQVQLEIGVQSTNAGTLAEINRPADFSRLSEVVSRLKSSGNIHLHLDLIAGLPYENLESFKASFDHVFSLRPHQLQLGFLKVLKGSPIEKNCDSYGLKYTDAPPYEVLETRWLSYGELLQLKTVEEMLETYYNSGQYVRSLELLLTAFDHSFDLFQQLGAWYHANDLTLLHFSRNQRYENLLRFGSAYVEEKPLREALIYDYYSRENEKNRPAFLGEDRVEKAFAKEFYSVEARQHRYLKDPQYEATTDPRVLRKLTHLEKLGDEYYLFDYTRRNPVTGNVPPVTVPE